MKKLTGCAARHCTYIVRTYLSGFLRKFKSCALHAVSSFTGLLGSHGATTMYIERGKKGPWLISPDVSAARASAIVSLLQALLHYEGEYLS